MMIASALTRTRQGDLVHVGLNLLMAPRTPESPDLILAKIPKPIRRTPIWNPGHPSVGVVRDEDLPTYGRDDPLPEGSPIGYPWMLWEGSRSHIDGGRGMDSSGAWWVAPSALWPNWWSGEMTAGGSDFLDQVQKFTIEVVLPTIGLVAGTAIGGVGGIAVAAAIAAATRLARAPGGNIGEAVIASTKDALPSLVASGVFDETLKRAKTYGLDKMYDYGKQLAVSDERDAFQKASVLAIAQVSQKKSLDELKSRYPAATDAIDRAARANASPLDIANAVGGTKEKIAMDQALARNAGADPTTLPKSGPLVPSPGEKSEEKKSGFGTLAIFGGIALGAVMLLGR